MKRGNEYHQQAMNELKKSLANFKSFQVMHPEFF